MTVYAYDVELSVVDKQTRAASTVTRREHAYNVHDALMQAAFGQGQVTPNAELNVIGIGPARELIDLVTRDLALQVASAMARITTTHGTGR